MRRILASALVAGFLAGLFVTAIQTLTTTPLLLEAERYESGEVATAEHAAGHGALLPSGGGVARLAFTAAANLVLAVGFALILVAIFALKGIEADGRRGVLWGLGGFAAFALAPALGLPPELPGSVAADLAARQVWWVATAVATAAGLGLLVYGRGVVWKAAAVLLLIAPHAVGAPHAEMSAGGPLPAELAARYVAASLVASALFWVALGWLSGAFYRRFA